MGVSVAPGLVRLPFASQLEEMTPQWSGHLWTGIMAHYTLTDRISLGFGLQTERRQFRYRVTDPDYMDMDYLHISLRYLGMPLLLDYRVPLHDQWSLILTGGVLLARRTRVGDNWQKTWDLPYEYVVPPPVIYPYDTRYRSPQVRVRPLVGVGYARAVSSHVEIRGMLLPLVGTSPVRISDRYFRAHDHLFPQLEETCYGGIAAQLEILYTW